jgi:hypothetical protein
MLLLAAAVFVGSQACRTCHTAISDSYARTPMAQSSGRVESFPAASFTAAGHRYRISGKQLIFDGGAVSFDYFVGSNSAGRSYIHEQDGYLFELPVTWYAQRKTWDASPGYEKDPEIRLTRPIELTCLLCHSSRVRPVLGTQNRYGDPPFLENGVSCERCHGPGSEHVNDPLKSPMVNPARLDAEGRDSVCSQCHLTGAARIDRPGRRMASFQAGERLADYATVFAWKPGGGDFKVTSHVEKLAASVCKQESGAALWCGTCHDPHTNADKSQSACLNCHTVAHRRQESCVSCHMPKARVADANHAVMTDHSIPRIPKASAPQPEPALVIFLGPADDRAVGLAYAELGDSRARQYLLRATQKDWQVSLRLAVLEPDPARAIKLYESVLRDNPGETAALVNLGSLYAKTGRMDDAGRLWEKALEANPATEEAVLNLSQIRPPEIARMILNGYLVLNPVSKRVRERLAAIAK